MRRFLRTKRKKEKDKKLTTLWYEHFSTENRFTVRALCRGPGKNNNLRNEDRSKSFKFLRGNSIPPLLPSLRQLLALENELKVSQRH